MRRFAAVLLSLVLLLTMAATGSAASDIRVLFDEQEVQFDANPFIEDSRTLVPVRALAERLGFTVGWNEAEQQITLTKGETTILLWIGSTKVVVSGKEGVLDAAPKQLNNRTFVPVRFVAEQLGAHVVWDDNERTAVITSGKSLFLKLNKQQKAADQKLTGDFQIEVEMGSTEKGMGGTMSVKIPVHVEMHLYQKNMLGHVTVQLPAAMMGAMSENQLSADIAVKDGKLYVRESQLGDWEEIGEFDMTKNVGEAAVLLKESGLGDLEKLAAELMQHVVATVAGEEEMDGAKVLRLDVDLSKLNFSELIDKLFTAIELPPEEKPEFELNVDRFLLQYWLNPDTQFTHKSTLDFAMGLSFSESGGERITLNMAMKGELRATPVSEPINFPDFGTPELTPEQQAAHVYWQAAEKMLTPDACAATPDEIDALWKAKSYTDGHDLAAKAAACFKQHREAAAALIAPQEFAEAHRALIPSLESSEKAYTVLAGAFELAAKGDLTAASAQKDEGDKLVATHRNLLIDVSDLLFRAAERAFSK